jgi:saccharopine dehydrogenase-like NADP-dependent oxidoreductase
MVVPRELAHRLLVPLIDHPEDPDLVVLRVEVCGRGGGRVRFEMLEHEDPETRWTAMERTTALPAAAVSILQARGEVAPGAVPLERSVPARPLLAEVRHMGLVIAERGD